MRRRGTSPWLTAEKLRRKETAPIAIARRIAEGDRPILVWREEQCFSIAALARKSKIDWHRLLDLEMGQAQPTPAEITALATAFNIAEGLLSAPEP